MKELHDIYPSAAIFEVVEPYASQRTTVVNEKLPKVLTDYYDANLDGFTLEQLRNTVIDFSITKEERDNVERVTRQQSSNEMWWKYRAGRITASQFRAVCKTKIEQPSASLVKTICNPRRKVFFTKETEYGKKNENNALKRFFSHFESGKDHSDIDVYPTGFFISLEKPQFGASPDSIAHCSCHGWAAVEVKCPFWMKDMKNLEEVMDFVRKGTKHQTLFTIINNELHLDQDHSYYYQVQLQMYVLRFKVCDFVVWAKGAYFHERISYNHEFLKLALEQASKFHEMVIKPELLARYYTEKVFGLPKNMQLTSK